VRRIVLHVVVVVVPSTHEEESEGSDRGLSPCIRERIDRVVYAHHGILTFPDTFPRLGYTEGLARPFTNRIS
jgi:hypothetical protein